MLTEKELLEAIDECQNKQPKTFSTAEKLAVFYTILDHTRAESSFGNAMSADREPKAAEEAVIGDHGATDFYLAIRGKEAAKVWLIFGELMEALKVLNPKLYNKAMERLEAL